MMIELSGVHFAHDRGPALLADVELAIAPGEVVAVEVQAGAGATTLLRLLLGELTARGRVAFAGRDVAKLRTGSRAALRRRLGVVPQDLGLIGRATALDNVAIALEVCGVPRGERRARARALLTSVDVEPDLPVDRLAMAARQRVAWARAIVRGPDAVLADQPTSHQDADGAGRFAQLVDDRAELGAACLVLTRDPHLIAAGARLGWRMLALHERTLIDVVPVMIEGVPSGRTQVGELITRPITDGAADFAPEITADFAPELAPVPRPDIAPERWPASAANAVDVAVDDLDGEADLAAIPNVVPFPVARSAGHRR